MSIPREVDQAISVYRAAVVQSVNTGSQTAAAREREALALVADLSDALTDEGPDWTEEGLHNLRSRVAALVPLDQLADWLHRYARQEPQPRVPTAGELAHDYIDNTLNRVVKP